MRAEKRPRIRPLLAVAAAAASLAACGHAQPDSTAHSDAPAGTASPASGSPGAVPSAAAGALLVPVESPRLLPSGSPAPGNVATRAMPALRDRR
jgi:hypothetical protein